MSDRQLTHPDVIGDMADDELGRHISTVKREIATARSTRDSDSTFLLEIELCYLQAEHFHRQRRREVSERLARGKEASGARQV